MESLNYGYDRQLDKFETDFGLPSIETEPPQQYVFIINVFVFVFGVMLIRAHASVTFTILG